MSKLLKKWFLKSIIFFISFSLILVILFILSNDLLYTLLYIFIGFLISLLFFCFIGIRLNMKISKKILKLNELVKKSFPSDVLNRNLYSSTNSRDEFEMLCDDVENVLFELKASERMKNDFISSMSHELRTPLTAIKGWAETMKTGEVIDFSTVRRGLDVIINEAARLSNLVNDLLDFSVLASGRLTMEMEKIDIIAEVEEAVYVFREKASIEQKKLIFNDPRYSVYVYGDKSRLKQVFVNLIDNAIKYTEKGGEISVSVSQKDNLVQIEVTDNGCGIEKNEVKNITKKFFKRNSKVGFGIGLSIVKEIIDAHKGKLRIISEKNFGTTVIVSLNSYKEEKS